MAENYYVLRLHHGTSKGFSNNIRLEGFKLPEVKRDDHWLGDGVYFYREDQEQAMIWAVSKFKRSASENEAHVLEVILNLNENEFLNIDSRAGIRTIHTFIRDSHKELEGIEFFGEPAKVRNFIMDLLPDKYTVIQRTFKTDSKLFDEDLLLSKAELCLHGVQVCVRNTKAITGDVSIVRKRPVFHTRMKKVYKVN